MGGCGRWHAGASAAAGEVGRGPPVRPHPSRGGRPQAKISLFPRREGVFRDFPPFSRRGKPISSKFYRLPAAGNRFSSDFSPFPPRETVFLRIFSISRRGKAFLKVSDRFRVSFSRFRNPEIGFASHFCVSEIRRSPSRRKMTFTATRNPHKNPPSGGLAVRTRGMFREERRGIYRLSTFIRLRKATVL